MKEFESNTGGRYTYAEDVLNLQELALAFNAVFDECDDFIVSGCKIADNKISSGLVYLNGKLRKFSGAAIVANTTYYIYENGSTESVMYVSGGSKVGRKDWGCAIGTSVPTSNDPLTNAARRSIVVRPDGTAPRMKDVWFGKYAVLKDPSTDSQTINSDLSVKKISAKQITGPIMTCSDHIVLANGERSISSFFENGNAIQEYSIPQSDGTLKKYRMVVDGQSKTIQLLVDGVQIAKFNNQGGNIGPKIFEDGVALETKYVKSAELNNKLNQFTSNAHLVDEQKLEDEYASLANGLSQFIIPGYATKDSLCEQIGAVKIKALGEYSTEAGIQAKIDELNSAIQALVPKDTGWITIRESGDEVLKARQINNIVYIQGRIRTTPDGIAFNLPAKISAPQYNVAYMASIGPNAHISFGIDPGSRACHVFNATTSTLNLIPITITYMI